MRAVWYDRQGAADEVLVCGELPTPNAGHGEVRVKLEASGVNPSDTYRRRGPPAMEYPRVITNSDGAGVIDQVGPGVDQQRLGKRVWLYNGQRNGRWMGTAAEYIALPVDLVTELPDHVSFAEGATLGVPAMTAHRAVFVAGPVQGKTLLVTGGAGAVGHYAVQLASWAGATVIATVSSSEKADRARAGGAAHVIDYRAEDVAERVLDITGGVGVDHIAEVDFGGNLAATLRCLRVNGSIMIYAKQRRSRAEYRTPTASERRPTSPRGPRCLAASCRWPRASRFTKRPRRIRPLRLAARLAPLSSNRGAEIRRCGP
jgi:NADPH:quinone reductase